MDTPKDISSLYRKMNTSVNVKLAPLGLSNSKAMFLFCIWDHKQMSQVEICRDLEMDKSTVAKMLVRLEKDGMITKAVNPDDVRSFLVKLTDKANAVVPEAKKIVSGWLDEVTTCLTDLEKRNFFELLEKVAKSASIYD